jgi:hypothetical protein
MVAVEITPGGPVVSAQEQMYTLLLPSTPYFKNISYAVSAYFINFYYYLFFF